MRGEIIIAADLFSLTRKNDFRVRDRDAPVTKEGLVFRTYGYCHPPRSCVCDVEYAPEQIYSTNDPRALRQSPSNRFFKFYADGGLQFVARNYPQYQLSFEPLQMKLVGLVSDQVLELRKPDDKLSSLLEEDQAGKDKLMVALREVVDLVTSCSKLRPSDFGVFGSVLHDFYHPDFSDLDFTVYGRENTQILRETLQDIYSNPNSKLVNEFDHWERWAKARRWFFRNMSIEEFCKYSKRKMVYATYGSKKARREFKVEFEPVREWNEINETYNSKARIRKIGWIKALAEILDDSDSFFMPSVYSIEVKKLLNGPSVGPIDRITSFVEEFRGQTEAGERVIVEGNLEEVKDSKGKHYQVTLTRTPDKYYEQVLKPASSNTF